MDARTALRTERLVLRPLCRDDIPDLVAGLNDYDVSKWLTVVPFPYGPADAEAFLDHLDAGAPFDGFGLTRNGGPVIGVVGIGRSLGYWLARPYHGAGYTTEAARALVGRYFRNTHAAALKSGHFVGNTASAGVLAKLGFRSDGTERVAARAPGRAVTLHILRLTRADWEARLGH